MKAAEDWDSYLYGTVIGNYMLGNSDSIAEIFQTACYQYRQILIIGIFTIIKKIGFQCCDISNCMLPLSGN